MQYGRVIKPTDFTTNIIDPAITTFDNTAHAQKGALRLYEQNIYKAYTNIYPLATYNWNDITNGVTAITTKLDDKTIIDSTFVSCVENETIVYIEDSWKSGGGAIIGKYYIYTGITGNVDFTSIDPSNPSNFSEINNYRHIDVTPSDTSIYWELVETINSKKHLDDTIYSQTCLDTTGTITNTYTIGTMIDTILFFNISLESIAITVTDISDNVLIPRYELDIRDYQGIMTPYSWFFTPTEGLTKDNAFTKITPYSSIKITIEYTNSITPPKIGETVFTRMIDIGSTADVPQGRKKKFDSINIDKNGKKKKISRPAIVDEITYTVYIETGRNDSVINMLAKIINENVIFIGDESGKLSNAIHYGWLSEHPYELDTSMTKNKYSLKITTLA